jgi:hypothetical protein
MYVEGVVCDTPLGVLCDVRHQFFTSTPNMMPTTLGIHINMISKSIFTSSRHRPVGKDKRKEQDGLRKSTSRSAAER